ncbi:MAG: hypothetical protein KGJ07_00100 [Patescibacteria group bacterium]|nr:hypothetical protein [Patescibacteria group bacterium]
MSQDLILADGTLMALEQTQINTQVSTAKAYPRDLKRSYNNALATIQLSKSIAESCIYSLPPRDGKPITGPSVRLAEIMLSTWTNMHFSTRVVGNNGKFISVQAIVIDRENNNICIETVDRSIMTSGKNGKTPRTYTYDMQQTTAAAAASIALRRATLRCLGKHFADMLYEEAKKVAVGDISVTRAKIIAQFEKNGVPKEKIFAYYNIQSIDDIDEEILADIIGKKTAIVEGKFTKDTAFDIAHNTQDEEGQPTNADEINQKLTQNNESL